MDCKELKKELHIKVKAILKGIDKDEADSNDGWWETSDGVEFGKIKLKELEELFK